MNSRTPLSRARALALGDARTELVWFGVFALLVWIPQVITAPAVQLNWSALLITVAIGAGAWVMAESLTTGRRFATVS